jgi:DNA-binding NarL/FixJ family response regulator
MATGQSGRQNQVLQTMEPELVALPSLLLADDNPALLETLVDMLEPTYKVAAALHNGVSVLEKFGALGADLIILDVSLGDITGFEVAKRLREAGCPAKILFLSVHEDIDFVNAAFDLGASGYVFKSRITTDLTKAIDIVFHGDRFASIIFPSKY